MHSFYVETFLLLSLSIVIGLPPNLLFSIKLPIEVYHERGNHD
jgi:hypothetical protein